MNKTNKYLLVPLGLLSMTALSGALLVSSNVNADNTDIVDEINITVPISCTLSGSGMTSHNASIANGTYNSNIGETTITTFCNDNSGFAIYAIGYTDNEEGKNVLTNSTLGSDYDIATGTQTSGDTSKWAMKLSTVTSPTPTYPITIQNSFDSFHTVPDDYTLVAKRTSGTDIGTSAEGSTLKSTYQAYISKTQAAGTYTGQVKYTLVHPHDSAAPHKEETTAAGKIGYYSNANDALGAMANQTLTALDKKDWSQCEYATDYETYCTLYPAPDGRKDINWINENLPDLDHYETFLWASNFHREGYGFAGWNTKPDYSGTNYGPNERIVLPSDIDTEKGLSLYAIWIPSTGTMQEFTTSQCSAMSVNQVIALTDNRDNNTYAIAKLADNKCWMIENLRLANEYTVNNVTTPVVLSSSNTNNPSLPLTNYGGGTSNSLSVPVDPTQTAWCIDNNSACVDQSMLATNNTASPNTMTSPNDNVYSYGNYYNWYSATAGSGTYAVLGQDVSGSICPVNWRLPHGGDNSSNEYALLSNALNSGTANSAIGFRSYPANFVYSGVVGIAEITHSTGEYWNSYAHSDPGETYGHHSQLLSLSKTAAVTFTYSYRGGGSAVRCLLAN